MKAVHQNGRRFHDKRMHANALFIYTHILGNSVKQFIVLAGASIGEMSCCALSPGHSLPDGAELGSRCIRENTIPLASLEGPPQNSLVVMLFISVVIEARCCSMQLLWEYNSTAYCRIDCNGWPSSSHFMV